MTQKYRGEIETIPGGFIVRKYHNGRISFYKQYDWKSPRLALSASELRGMHRSAVITVARDAFGHGGLMEDKALAIPCDEFDGWGFTKANTGYKNSLGEVNSVFVDHYKVV
jgi:hypothetical protein